jgi:hypothetical protein
MHVQQHQAAQHEQAEGGERRGPPTHVAGQPSQYQQRADSADGVGDDGHRDAGVGEPVLGPVDVEQGDRRAHRGKRGHQGDPPETNADRRVLSR